MATPATQPIPNPLSMAAVLRIPIMRRLWYAQVISVFGDFLALFAVIGVLTFRLNASAQQVINLQIAYLLPIAILGVVAGVFVDRWPLKPTLVSSDAIRCGLVLLLLLCTRLWQFYAVLAAISVISSFFGPAQGVAIRSAVPLHGLRSANALMQQVIFGMRIIGPALAALLVATFGPRVCYLADATSFAGSALLIASIPFVLPTPDLSPQPAPDPSPRPTPDLPSRPEQREVEGPASPATPLRRIFSDMQVGFHFILHHAALLFVILALAAGMFVLGCFGPLIAVYVRDSVHASTRVFGVASAGIGVGLFVGINLLTVAGKRLSNNLLVYAGLSGIAAGLALLTGLTHIWSTVLGTITIGFATAGIIIPSQTLIQTETPPALMGRVGSTVMSVVFSAQIAGLILSGLLATHIGVRHVFAVCAILLALLITAGRLFMEPRPAATSAS
jgi:DHA3 family macrolide efflux protein-like MFS transporter